MQAVSNVTLNYRPPSASSPPSLTFTDKNTAWMPPELQPGASLKINLAVSMNNVNLIGLIFMSTMSVEKWSSSTFGFYIPFSGPGSPTPTPFSLTPFGTPQPISGKFSNFIESAATASSSVTIEIIASDSCPEGVINFQVLIGDFTQSAAGLYYVSDDPQITLTGPPT